MAAPAPVWGCGVRQSAAVLPQLRLGPCLGDHRKPVCFLLPASGASIPKLLGSRGQALHSPPISPSGPPTSKRACLPFVGPQAPGIRGSLLLQSPFSSKSPHWGTDSDHLSFSLSSCFPVYFSYSLVCIALFLSLSS